MSGPRISVIICVRDGEAYLREALDSVAAQHHSGLDVIVVDDGSRDRSAAIAQSHALRPRVLSQEPLGLSASLNIGMRHASGTFVAFLDCDDVWPPGRLDAMLAALSHQPQLDGVYGKVVNTDSQLNAISPPIAVQLAGAMVLRRASAQRVGPFRTDVTHAAILDWISRATAAGLQFRVLDLVVLLRRIHGDNLGIRQRSQMHGDLLRVIRDHWKRSL